MAKAIFLPPPTDALNPAQMLSQIVGNAAAGQGGFTAADLKKRMRIMDMLDAHKAPGPLVLEDADHAELKRIVEGFSGFAVVRREIIAMCDAVSDAETVNAA